MQVVIFKKSKWRYYRVSGDKYYPGFFSVRLGRVELRFGRGYSKLKWGRLPNDWAYENG